MAGRNPLFVIDNLIEEVVSRRINCDLVAVSGAFVYDINEEHQKLENCDLVVASSRGIIHSIKGVYVIPFICGQQRGDVFAEIAKRGIVSPRADRFMGMVTGEQKPVLYNLDGNDIAPSEYFVTDLSGLIESLSYKELQKIFSYSCMDYQ